jgi:hypothetical protein
MAVNFELTMSLLTYSSSPVMGTRATYRPTADRYHVLYNLVLLPGGDGVEDRREILYVCPENIGIILEEKATRKVYKKLMFAGTGLFSSLAIAQILP